LEASLAQLVIAWTLKMPGITVALVGARNPDQVIQNAGALHVHLSREDMDQIHQVLDPLELDLD
jgi:aryl-alcohol dehydrogenase-like predicted oxidoreductase